jgi:transposase
MTKRINKDYPAEFKQEAVALVIEQDYSIVQETASLWVTDKYFTTGSQNTKSDAGDALSGDE